MKSTFKIFFRSFLYFSFFSLSLIETKIANANSMELPQKQFPIFILKSAFSQKIPNDFKQFGVKSFYRETTKNELNTQTEYTFKRFIKNIEFLKAKIPTQGQNFSTLSKLVLSTLKNQNLVTITASDKSIQFRQSEQYILAYLQSEGSAQQNGLIRISNTIELKEMSEDLQIEYLLTQITPLVFQRIKEEITLVPFIQMLLSDLNESEIFDLKQILNR